MRTFPPMLVECNNCGAPLDVRGRDRFVTCRYCDRTNEVRSLKTTAMKTPEGWKPPQKWKPPERAAEPSAKELRYHQGLKHQVTRARNNKKGCSFAGCFLVIIPMLPFVINLVTDNNLQALFESAVGGGSVTPSLGTASLTPPGGSSRYEGKSNSSRSASSMGNPSCSGEVPTRPHVALAVSEATHLVAAATGTDDLTLLVKHPDGSVDCDDDSGGNRMPLLSTALAPGVHHLYVGTFTSGESGFDLSLEWDSMGAMPGPDGLATAADPALGTLEIVAGEASGSYVGEARGIVEASRARNGCDGYLSPQPELRIVSHGPATVELVTESDVDLVMLVRDSAGTVHCDDDSGGNRQPRLQVTLPDGQHAVWIGTFTANERAPFTLVATAGGEGAIVKD